MKKWKINSFEDLEKCIKYDLSEIDFSTLAKGYYADIIKIPKNNGEREICVIDKRNILYKIQKNLKKNFLDNIMLSDRAFGFIKNQSYFDYLSEHASVGQHRWYLRIDIEDFFGSINGKHIDNAFDFYIDGEEKKEIIETLKSIVIYNDKLIQGTPIAPVISNIVFRQLDIRIERYCDRCGVIYSRYADDLLFSSDSRCGFNRRFVKTIDRILASKDFRINNKKTRLSENMIVLNGFVIENAVRLSRKKMKHISGMVYYLENTLFEDNSAWYKEFNECMQVWGYSEFNQKSDIINALAGNRSFLISAVRYIDDSKYKERLEKLIGRIEEQISKIS